MYLHLLISAYAGALLSPLLGLVLAALGIGYWLLVAWGARNLDLAVQELSSHEAAEAGERALARRGSHRAVEQRVSMEVDGAKLRGILALPDKGPQSDIAIVVTHPWAIMGGNMDNNVPMEVSRAFASMGHAALRFNFRGWGVSRGEAEVSDLTAAARWLLREVAGVRRVLLVGYSYGSVVAGAALAELGEAAAGLVTISPPWPWAWLLFLGNARSLVRASLLPKPKLFLLGAWDIFTPPSFWRKALAEFPAPISAVLVRGCGHFWPGSELCLVGQIAAWMEKGL